MGYKVKVKRMLITISAEVLRFRSCLIESNSIAVVFGISYNRHRVCMQHMRQLKHVYHDTFMQHTFSEVTLAIFLL